MPETYIYLQVKENLDSPVRFLTSELSCVVKTSLVKREQFSMQILLAVCSSTTSSVAQQSWNVHNKHATQRIR